MSLLTHPVASVAVTLASYAVAVSLHRRWKWIPPIIAACLPICAYLICIHEPWATYNTGGNVLTWLLGPATVSLAVPMYRNGQLLKGSLGRLALIVLVGAIVGMATAGFTAHLLGAPREVAMAAVPKSVTTPIAIEVSRELHGIPQITIALVILAGILGASFGVPLLNLVGVRGNRSVGAAMGSASHGVGTASLVHRSEMQASVSSWAMAASGIFTSLLATALAWILK